MAREYLSLREIGRRLNIPPSSVVYYKDRFARHIPMHGQPGRRAKYPAEALGVFREIREMFNKNWSSEQIEEHLQAACAMAEPDAGTFGDGGAGFGPGSGGRHEVMDRMAGLLESHALFRAQIESLRTEVEGLRAGRRKAEDAYRERIARLEHEVETLRRERAELQGRDQGPPRELLSLPLVIRKNGEYLGVAGKNGHFVFGDFVGLIERRQHAGTGVDLRWSATGGVWTLAVTMREPGGRRVHELEVEETTTPSNNRVARLVSMTVDDQPVPDRYLLLLFRNIREEFEKAEFEG